MEVGRNDLCPCGSGKKYKKCCMKKAQVIEIGQVKRERFFQLKYELVQGLVREVFPSFSMDELKALEKEFEARVETEIPDSFFQHWLLFFHRDAQGLRGIESYNRAIGNHRDPILKELALDWEKMIPRLIQQVDYDEHGVIVEDLFSNEKFYMPFCETMPEWIPWAGTICMLEEFDGGYYINGVATSVGPDSLKNAYEYIEEKMKENQSTPHEVAFEHYPEILRALLLAPDYSKDAVEIIQTELQYEVQNTDSVFQMLQADDRFYMDESKGSNGKGAYLKKIYHYIDNCAPGPVRIAEVEGSVEITDKKLVYSTLSVDEAVSFKNKLSSIQGVKLVEEKADSMMASPDTKVAFYSVMLANGVPQEFATIAQRALLLEEMDQPMPFFAGRSPVQMAAAGKTDELEQWLRKHEYGSYVTMKNTAGQVKVTADFNTMRRRLDLELSPFVTLREERNSRLVPELPAEAPVEVPETPAMSDTPAPDVNMPVSSSVTEEDLKLMEEIGIPFEEAEQFYVKDILECFREKGEGKSQSTYYKYRLGLQTIGYFLSQKIIYSWNDVNEDDWRKWLTFNYLAFNMDATVNQVKGFMSVLKNFIDKIDGTYGTKHAPVVKKLIKELEPSILAAVKVMDSYASYQERRNEPEYDMDPLFDTIASGPATASDKATGLFEVKTVNETGVTMRLLGAGQSDYTTLADAKYLEHLEPGMVIFGQLENQNQWQLSKIYRTFPSQSVQYIDMLVTN
ncbi:SEC-C metal-binding domain-containing protein [Bacillus tuaregi]|uniref:SEC-C metal-binding domain-containing protein n=1 Tax=Bacillus tuaregi TaxID=1816695 RepID=UPI0008F8963A|nr:SEC-C metal-binding domain-containing protein [Bacillus tuaregi]